MFDMLQEILTPVVLSIASGIAAKYVIPFLQVGKRQKYAEHIATLADDITEDLMFKYPNNTWLQKLDDGVDLLIAMCNIKGVTARRAINAAVSRRQRPRIN